MSQYAHTGQQSYEKPRKNYVVALLLSFFLGGLGVDRFYLGHIGLGITKLLLNGFITIITFGLGGWIWWLIDFIMIVTRNVNSDEFVWDDEVQQPYQQAPYPSPDTPGQPFHGAPGQAHPQQSQAPQGMPEQSAQQPTPFTPYTGPGAAPTPDTAGTSPAPDTQPTGSWQHWEAPADTPAPAPADDTPVAPVPVETPRSVSTPPPAPEPADEPVQQAVPTPEPLTPTTDSENTPADSTPVETIGTPGDTADNDDTTTRSDTADTAEQRPDDTVTDRDDDQGTFPWKQQ